MLHKTGEHYDACVIKTSYENDNKNRTRISDPHADLSEVIPVQTGPNLIYSGGDDRNLPGVHDTSSRSSDNLSDLVDHGDAIKELNSFRVNHPKNLIFCHYNINSIRNKSHE